MVLVAKISPSRPIKAPAAIRPRYRPEARLARRRRDWSDGLRTLFAGTGAGESPGAIRPDDAARVAVFLDVDGTLLDLAERPDVVVVPAELIVDLVAARNRADGALALVSGRPVAELDRLFTPLRLPAAGVHGAELRFDPEDTPSAAVGAGPLPAALWAALRDVLRDFPGTFVENKRYSFAIHYRQARPHEDALRARLAGLLQSLDDPRITMLQAHCAFELKPRAFDKGRAIQALLSHPPFAGRRPVFIGDDDTDEAGFAVVTAAGGLAYSVGRRRPHTAATFANPAAVRAWLAAFAEGGE